MAMLLLGILIFFGVHSISLVSRPWRDRMAERTGAISWMMIYSALSIIGLVLIIWGYGAARADPVVLYHPPGGLRHLAMLLMLPVFPLVFAAYLPGRIQSATRHPMLLAVILWALAHLMNNGTLADVLLFGVFLVWAVAVRVSLIWRVQRSMISAPATAVNDAIAVVAGLALYAAFLFHLHGSLIGAPLIT